MLLWEAAFSFNTFFWRLSMCLSISQWVIYKRPCPHCAECPAVYDKRQLDPCAPPSLLTWSQPEWLYFISQMKTVLKRKCFASVEEMKQKVAEALKNIEINEFKTVLSSGKKCLNSCITWNGKYFEGRRQKVKHVRLNTQFFIHKFHILGILHCTLWKAFPHGVK